jgi:hypothetical protein
LIYVEKPGGKASTESINQAVEQEKNEFAVDAMKKAPGIIGE